MSAKTSFAGRGALVTGGGRGIGAVIAAGFAKLGAAVVVAARTQAEIETVARLIGETDGRAWAVRADVSDEDSVRGLVARAHEHMGAVDILVNAAGDGAAARVERITMAAWRAMLDAHVTGTFLCTREVLPGMRERGYGRIVNIASVAGLRGARYVAHYCAAKHAVVGFTRAVALEIAGSGVTVNALCPGYVDTPMTAQTVANVVARTGRSTEEALASVLETTGQERLLTTLEVAGAAVGLCGDAEASTNGQAITLMPGLINVRIARG